MNGALESQVANLAGQIQPIDPRQIWVLRIRVTLISLFVLLVALALDRSFAAELGAPAGVASIAVLATGMFAILFLPGRRYRAWRS